MTPMMTSTGSDLSRRSLLAGIAAAGVLAFLPAGARALTTQQASDLVSRAVGEINTVIASGKSEQAMYRDFSALLGRYADVDVMARSALGPAARTTSAADLRRYTQAFQQYLGRKYGQRFREFIGGEVTVTGATQLKSFHEVRATARLRGQQPMDVRFQVSDRSGSNKFFNIIVEGVNLLSTERTEIGAILEQQRGSIDGLISVLNASS